MHRDAVQAYSYGRLKAGIYLAVLPILGASLFTKVKTTIEIVYLYLGSGLLRDVELMDRHVGTATQSNYLASNASPDAFAHHRH